MFFENELTRTLTLIEFLLAVLVGLAPIAVTIWVKLVLYRRRVAEDEKLRQRALTISLETLPRAQAGFLTPPPRQCSNTASRAWSASFPRHSIGANPSGFLSHCTRLEALNSKNEKGENQ